MNVNSELDGLESFWHLNRVDAWKCVGVIMTGVQYLACRQLKERIRQSAGRSTLERRCPLNDVRTSSPIHKRSILPVVLCPLAATHHLTPQSHYTSCHVPLPSASASQFVYFTTIWTSVTEFMSQQNCSTSHITETLKVSEF